MKKPPLSGLTSVSACLLHFYDTLCLKKRRAGGAAGRKHDGRGCDTVCREVSGEAKRDQKVQEKGFTLQQPLQVQARSRVTHRSDFTGSGHHFMDKTPLLHTLITMYVFK